MSTEDIEIDFISRLDLIYLCIHLFMQIDAFNQSNNL